MSKIKDRDGLEIIQSREEFEKVVNGIIPSLVVFSEVGCPWCKKFGPIAKKLADQCKDKLVVRAIIVGYDGWAQELIKGLEITGLPESLYYENGEIIKRVEGFQSYSTLLASLSKNSDSMLFRLFSKLIPTA